MTVPKDNLMLLRRSWLPAWSLLLLLIPALSFFGRSLQRFSQQHIEPEVLAWLIGLPTLLLAFAFLLFQIQRHGRRLLWHLVWLIPLAGLLPLTLPAVEERLHFLLFGAFGLASGRTFHLPLAILVSVSAAGLDELFQAWLPDRVGDWRDVGFNLLSVAGGLLLARAGGR